MQTLLETGVLHIPVEDGPRETVVISQQTLNAFAEGDQRKMLARIRAPVLLINGDADPEERMLAKISNQALAFLPAGSRAEVIAGARHSFLGKIDEVIAMGADWLSASLARASQ